MSMITIELADRSWREFDIHDWVGIIEKFRNKYVIKVELPMVGYMHHDYESVIEITDQMVGKTVIGDIGGGRFYIRIICLYDVISIE